MKLWYVDYRTNTNTDYFLIVTARSVRRVNDLVFAVDDCEIELPTGFYITEIRQDS